MVSVNGGYSFILQALNSFCLPNGHLICYFLYEYLSHMHELTKAENGIANGDHLHGS